MGGALLYFAFVTAIQRDAIRHGFPRMRHGFSRVPSPFLSSGRQLRRFATDSANYHRFLGVAPLRCLAADYTNLHRFLGVASLLCLPQITRIYTD